MSKPKPPPADTLACCRCGSRTAGVELSPGAHSAICPECHAQPKRQRPVSIPKTSPATPDKDGSQADGRKRPKTKAKK